MSEPIEKIVDTGIGSDYNSGQVWLKCWKIRGLGILISQMAYFWALGLAHCTIDAIDCKLT